MATSPYDHLVGIEKVVAIDFGSFGFASCFCAPNSPKDQRMVEDWSMNRAATDLNKNLAALLIEKKTNETIAMGYDAEEQYAKLIEKKQDDKYMYFQHFKPLLYSKDHLRKNVPVLSSDGKSSLPLRVLIIKSFGAIMHHSLKVINDLNKLAGWNAIDAAQVYWVISVPAIWDEMSKEMMKDCAGKAGMRYFSLGSEPTCTVFHVLNNTDIKLNNKTGNSQFIVLDCGGGTIDASCVEISPETGSVNELHFSEGMRCGGLDVDEKFLNLLSDLIPKDVITKIQNIQPGEWVRQRQEFVSSKFNVAPFQFDTVEFWNVEFCFFLKNWLLLQKRKSKKKDKKTNKKDQTYKNLQKQIKAFSIANIESKDEKQNEYDMISGQFKLGSSNIKIKSAGWLWLHEAVLKQIVDFLTGLVNKIPECDNIILSGGFANSEYLKTRLYKEFPGKKFYVPKQPHLAVAKGALYWVNQAGNKDVQINEIIQDEEKNKSVFKMNKTRAKYSYGIAIDRLWRDTDKVERKVNDKQRGVIVKNAFGTLVSRNEKYEDGYTEDFDYWIPSGEKLINIVLYASEDRFCRYVFNQDGKTLPTEEGKRCFRVKQFPLMLDKAFVEKQEFKITLEYRTDGINLSFIDPNDGTRKHVEVDTTARPDVV